MDFTSRPRETRVRSASDRSFGWVFAAVFAIVALWPLLDARPPRAWALAASAAFALAAGIRPGLLAPLNRGWTRLGLAMHRVTNPVVLTLIYALTIVPTGVALRLLGKDPLRLRRDPDAASYWIAREPPGPVPGSLQRRF